ncbi:hypothetical protein HK405_009514 [Cladochytrium tenue]|nr:hypothetical protein HK405_009514 [Cladochytrium tenue]
MGACTSSATASPPATSPSPPLQSPDSPPPTTDNPTAAPAAEYATVDSFGIGGIPTTALTPFAELPHKLLKPQEFLKFLGDTDPKKSGWHLFEPPDELIVQFTKPVAITRLGLHPVNTGHSPRTAILYGDKNDAPSVQNKDDYSWFAFAKIVCPDKNRKREKVPPNGHGAEGTTHFDIYFWGDDAIDKEARPDVLPLKNRVLAYPPAYDQPKPGDMKLAPRFPRFASRRWRLEFLDEKEKPLKWVGINDISFYGYESFFPPPEKVHASIVDRVVTKLLEQRKALSEQVDNVTFNLALSWEEIEQHREADILAVLRGAHGFVAVDRVFDYRTAKVFLSSTFADAQAERNFIMAHGVPLIQEVCRSLGEDGDLQRDLWSRVRSRLPMKCFVEYEPEWKNGGSLETEMSYLNSMCTFFVSQVAERIKLAAKHRRLLSPVEKEALAHVQFATDRSKRFFGRSELRDRCVSAVLADDNRAAMTSQFVVLHGETGVGKTSLMCSTAVTVSQMLRQTKNAMNRSLTEDQKVVVQKAISSGSNVSALHVRLLTDVVSKWNSYYKPTELPSLMQDFIVERGVNNMIVLSFFHRQFYEVAEEIYLKTQKDREDSLLLLYRYFSGRLAREFEERNISPQPLFFKPTDGKDTGLPNFQRLRESLHALIGLGDSMTAAAEICSLEYVKAKFSVGASFGSDLLNEIIEVQQLLEKDLAISEEPEVKAQIAAAKKRIRDFYLFVFSNYQALVADPSLALCIAWNFPKDHALHLAAVEFRKGDSTPHSAPLFRIVAQHNPSASNSAQGTITFDATETREAIDQSRLMDVNSPPDSSIFAVTQRGFLTIYDRRTLRERFSKPAGLPAVFWTAAAVSLNAEYFAAATSDGSLRVCLASDGEDLALFRHAHVGWITCIDWAPAADLRLATAGSDNLARVWWFNHERKELEVLAGLYGHLARVTSIRFSPTGSRLATSSLDGRVLLFSSKTFELLQAFETSAITCGTCVQWCPALHDQDGHILVGEELVVSFDRQRVVFWPVSPLTDKHCRKKGHSWPRLVIGDAGFAEINYCSVSPDGSEILAVGGDRCGRIFDRVTGKLVSILLDHSKPISKCDWDDDTIQDDIRTIQLGSSSAKCVAWPSQAANETVSDRVAVGMHGREAAIRIVDLGMGREIGTLPASGWAFDLHFFADNTRLVCLGRPMTTVWDVGGLMTGTAAAPESPLGQVVPALGGDVSQDGRRAVLQRAGGNDWNYSDVEGAWAVDLVEGEVLFEIVDGFGGNKVLEDQARRSVKLCRITKDGRFAVIMHRALNPRGRPVVCVHDLDAGGARVAVFASPFKTELSQVALHPGGDARHGIGAGGLPVFAVGDEEGRVFVVKSV